MDYYFYEVKLSKGVEKGAVLAWINNNFKSTSMSRIVTPRNRVVFYGAATSKQDFINAYITNPGGVDMNDIEPAYVYDLRNHDDVRAVCFRDNSINKQYKKVLIIGTHITDKSLEAGFFYLQKSGSKVEPLVKNRFWELLSNLYQYEFRTNNIEDLKEDLINRHIALADIYEYWKCTGPSDEEIITINKDDYAYNEYLKKSLLKEAEVIVYNGKSTRVLSKIRKLIRDCGLKKTVVGVYSSSNYQNSDKGLDTMLLDWQKAMSFLR